MVTTMTADDGNSRFNGDCATGDDDGNGAMTTPPQQTLQAHCVVALLFARRVPTRRCNLVVPADWGWGRSN